MTTPVAAELVVVMAGIRIVLADDHRMIREGLRALLKGERDFEVVGEAEEGRTAVRLAKELVPDVVVMDLRMPDLNGVDATRQVLRENPAVKVVALSAQSDPQSTTAMLQAGAAGYVIKDAAFEELIAAIRAVVAGRVYLSPAVAGPVVSRLVRPDGTAPAAATGAFSVLSGREREVLQLIAEGKSTKEVAAVLHVSVKTVETHRQHLMQKLGVDGVAELTKYAIREGLTGL